MSPHRKVATEMPRDFVKLPVAEADGNPLEQSS